MSDACSNADPLVSGPRSTQPTFSTGCISWIPIHSVTAAVVDARCLTVLNTGRRIYNTPRNVGVIFFCPALQAFYEKYVKYQINSNAMFRLMVVRLLTNSSAR